MAIDYCQGPINNGGEPETRDEYGSGFYCTPAQRDRLARVVMLILIVKFFQQALRLKYTDTQDLLFLAVGIVLMATALMLAVSLLRFSSSRVIQQSTFAAGNWRRWCGEQLKR